jgi:SAM-dependent methyltransferase
MGVEAMGVEAMGLEATGVEATGVEAMGVEAMGVESMGVEAAERRSDGAGSSRGRESPSCLLCGDMEADPFLDAPVQLAPKTGETFRFVRCRACSLVYLRPRPSEAEAGIYYPPGYLPHRGPDAWGRWAPLVRMAERGLDRRRVRWVTRRSALGGGTRVLDVGCGRPTFLRRLQDRTGAMCVGIDVSDAGWAREGEVLRSGLHLARTTLPKGEPMLRRMVPGGFHLLTLWHALEHAYDPLATLRSLRRLAAPGALLVVEVPDLDSLSARLHGEGWAGLHTPRHTAAYTPKTLRAMLTEAGWKVSAQLRHGTLDAWVLWWLGRRIRRGDPMDGPLEGRFPGFVAGKGLALPITLLQRWIPLGIQTALAEAPASIRSGAPSPRR